MKVGLSLSGGGYRAAAFHLGTLKKLHELGILEQIDVISTVSGGSITGAYYCLNHADFTAFERKMSDNLCSHSVIRFILTSLTFARALLFIGTFLGAAAYLSSTKYHWTAGVVVLSLVILLIRYQFKIFPVSHEVERAYDRFFFDGATLSALTNRPELAIASTNLQTCRPFTFSKRKMEDSTYAYDAERPIKFESKNFPLARAVAASSCVPFAFSPVQIDKQYFQCPDDFERVNPKLIDGGVYDNQGIHKLTQRGSSYECTVIITSDAGNKLPFKRSYNNTFTLLLRTVDTFMIRIKNVQMAQHLYSNTQEMDKQVAYFSLGWELQNCIPGFINALKAKQISKRVVLAHAIPEEWLSDVNSHREALTELLKQRVKFYKIWQNNITDEEAKISRAVSTNLMALSQKQLMCLMKCAANLTELQVRLYCPSLLKDKVEELR